ncbi:hypothetical protein Scep_009196 [Stephania cephalantha]|uniref:Uncharacterized protein n=1 Tax=Stephania cephalantha TaxID=152367 RepID=A0AAP0JV14_9MAGN
MATEVLRPQDCLVHRLRVPTPAAFHRRKIATATASTTTSSSTNPNTNNHRSCRKQSVRTEQNQKRRLHHHHQQQQQIQSQSQSQSQNQPDPSGFRRSAAAESSSTAFPAKKLVIGQVTILKRGESLDLKIRDEVSKKDETLKRTESVEMKDESLDLLDLNLNLIVCGTERLGPDPEMVPKQIRIKDLKTLIASPTGGAASGSAGSVGSVDVYAGSAFSLSPSPRALPLPRFSTKRDGARVVDDSATKDLRRLLRLE